MLSIQFSRFVGSPMAQLMTSLTTVGSFIVATILSKTVTATDYLSKVDYSTLLAAALIFLAVFSIFLLGSLLVVRWKSKLVTQCKLFKKRLLRS